MAKRNNELRRAVGAALRRLRNRGEFSLDDVQRGTTAEGMRVTRSHLSRVENGEAELSLPRFLALVRALGEPPGEVAESLAALLDGADRAPDEVLGEAREAMRLTDPGRAAAILRAAAARLAGELPLPMLEAWARAEASLGRWTAAARALSMALAPSPRPASPRPLLRLAVCHLGAGQPGLALSLARTGSGEAAWAIETAAWLESGLPLASAPGGDTGDRPLDSVALLVLAEGRRRAERGRDALQTVRRALDQRPGELLRGEALVLEARICADLRRLGPGLRAAHEARAIARRISRPELLVRAHIETARLSRLAGEPEEARTATRAAKILLARHGADRRASRCLPLQALYAAAGRLDREGGGETGGETEGAPTGPGITTLS